MQRKIWSKPGQWLHNLTKAHRPSQLYLQLFILLYFSSPTIFHFLPIFNLFSSVFSHPHTSTVLDIYTTHFWVLSHLLWDLHVKTDTLSYLFMTFIFLFIFLLSHATYLSFPLKSFLSSVFSSLSLSLSLSLWWISRYVKHDCV